MSGGFNPINMVSQVALGALTGGTSIIAQMAMQIATQVASQVIEQVGQQLGLPQPIIDGAQGMLAATTGNPALAAQEFGSAADGVRQSIQDAGNAFNSSPSEVGQFQREVSDIVRDLVQQGTNSAEHQKGTTSSKGDSFLVALAKALGSVLDEKMTKMKDLADDMNQTDNSDQSRLGSLGGELSAVGQEVKSLSEALNNSIKSLGEAQATLARKG